MIKRLGSLMVGIALVGCGGADVGTVDDATENVGPEPAAESVVKAEAETLNEFTTAEQQFRFLRVPGESPTYLLEFENSAYSESLLEPLMREHPQLTLLETFYALAPTGETPHPGLVEFHAIQAGIFGRSDTAVQRVDFNVHRISTKSATACTNYTISQVPAGQTWQSDRLNAVSKPNGGNLGLLCPAWLGLPGCDHQSIGGTHIISGCNDGPSRTAHWWSYRRGRGNWVESQIHFETPGGFMRGWILPEHSTGGFTDVQVMGIRSDDIHLAGEAVPSYHVRAGYSF